MTTKNEIAKLATAARKAIKAAGFTASVRSRTNSTSQELNIRVTDWTDELHQIALSRIDTHNGLISENKALSNTVKSMVSDAVSSVVPKIAGFRFISITIG